MADDILLNCMVHGETPAVDCVFIVKVAKSERVDILKDIIKEKQQPAFNHIRASQLSLWKVSLPLDSNVDKVLKQLVLEDNITKGVQKLLPTKKLSSYFTDEPAEEHLHVIVEPPSVAVVPSKREREQEAEAPQKVQKILGATSVSGTRIFETIAEKSGTGLGKKVRTVRMSQELVLPYGIPNFINFRTRAGMIFADKTMYIEHLEKCQPDYRYMFLRPRRFGKSAFLNMLCHYYDIHHADIFNDLFDKLETSFNTGINQTLRRFIKRYGKELGYPEVNNVLDTNNASASLRRVLRLAGKFDHTLFVGVDEYDAPVNNRILTGIMLKQGCGMLDHGPAVIGKYFLTGVTPAFRAGISPLAEAVIVSDEPSLHGICGFTESEVKTIVQHYLSKDEQEAGPIIHNMQKLYNGYFFSSSGYNESNPQPPLLYNPHLVFHYIRKLSIHGLVANPEESTAVHSTAILKSISDIGEFSVKDLEDLIINGSVSSKIKAEFGFSDLLSIGKDRTITWSLLYYLGILTRHPNGNLRIPNDIIKSDNELLVICVLIGPAIENLCRGRTNEFVKLLETFLETRALRPQARANESVLQGVVEVLLDEPNKRVPELRLVLDGTKRPEDGRFGFVDIFIHPMLTSAVGRWTCGVVLELKNIMLEGLWNGEMNDWDKQPIFSDLEKLQDKLCKEDDKSLLARKYMYWSEEKHGPVSTTVGDVMADAVKQLEKYMQTIRMGKPKSYYDSGVLDSRVRIGDGHDNLQGHAIITIG
ncbi:41151_t:CDS:2, partial [Gigaspora margarita]